MKKNNISWADEEGNEPDKVKKSLSTLSLKVRQQQFDIFLKCFCPKKNDKVIDVGVSAVEMLPDINFFEKKYPYPRNLVAASIDDPYDFPKRYPQISYRQIVAGKKLPFKDKTFEIVVSWATLEHVGDKKKQKLFLTELFRIGKKVFITTPYRGSIYEPHSGLFFVHWLPRNWFRGICKVLGKEFWANENNLRCLWKWEAKELMPELSKTRIMVYKTYSIIPSHLIIMKS